MYDQVIRLRCTEAERRRWMAAARRQGEGFSAWAREILTRTAKRQQRAAAKRAAQ